MNKLGSMRMGLGFDAHAFCKGDHVILGGVRIAHHAGIAAHSDGDVLLHALCDALLGALALGDLGTIFPSDDQQWHNACSRMMLRHVMNLVREQGYTVGNVDSTIIAQAPKCLPHVTAMRTNIAEDLAVGLDQISVKATTTDHLGFCGRHEGLAAQACVVMIS